MGGMKNDLGKLKGIGPKRTAMLDKIGVDSVKELAHRNADSLTETIRKRHGAAAGVNQKTVQGWITLAKRADR
ncbi:MAG: DUF4332 domain-containing protein [Chloroflexi bacterium]|nr:DUF4332 domain-containing protein [Chloroflexota bacterium]